MDGGVSLPVDDGGALGRVGSLLQEADAAVRGGERVPDLGSPFWPHVSVAYATAEADPGEPAGALAPETTKLTVSRVSLIRLIREDRLYRWEPLARVRLVGEP